MATEAYLKTLIALGIDPATDVGGGFELIESTVDPKRLAVGVALDDDGQQMCQICFEGFQENVPRYSSVEMRLYKRDGSTEDTHLKVHGWCKEKYEREKAAGTAVKLL